MNIERFYRRLDQYYGGNRSVEAECHLKESLQVAREEKDYSALLVVCNEMGGYLRAMGRPEEAVPIYTEAITALRKLGMFNTENHATTLINQATNYAVCGMTAEALEIFETAKFMLNTLGITVDFRIASLHNNISILYQDIKKYDEALEHLDSALQVLSQLEDTEIEVATTYINMAQIKIQADDYGAALEYIERSLSMFAAAKALTDNHYSVALETHGHICEHLEMLQDALVSYKKAAILVEDQFGMGHPGYTALMECVKRVTKKIEKEREVE